ncbi:MAG: 50S ribosomal protein L24 [Buchnera aphidicola (Eriosoma harunire)]
MAAKIKKNDEVVILTGKEKGKKGIVQRVIDTNKVIVSGLNLVTRHQKPVPSRNQSGGIIKKESRIDISNVAIINPVTGKPDRIGFMFKSGKKVRFFKSNQRLVGVSEDVHG